MPYKDPEKRKQKAAEYSLNYYYREREKKDDTVCTQCKKPRDDPRFKKCSACRQYMRAFKKDYRAQEKPPDTCTATDCMNVSEPPFNLCLRCRLQGQVQVRKPHVVAKRADWRRSLKPAVIVAYGGQCLCCKTTLQDLLTVDHINGYKGIGPRKGWQLYSWLKQNDFPADFRVLCMTCNFTLGHHGYCPHSNLTQIFTVGQNREYNQALKLLCLNAYGGPICVCCGEVHPECLSIDHVANDGAEHRRKEPKAKNLYIWLRQNNFPPGFRVLCHGCNFALGHFGACPHELHT